MERKESLWLSFITQPEPSVDFLQKNLHWLKGQIKKSLGEAVDFSAHGPLPPTAPLSYHPEALMYFGKSEQRVLNASPVHFLPPNPKSPDTAAAEEFLATLSKSKKPSAPTHKSADCF